MEPLLPPPVEYGALIHAARIAKELSLREAATQLGISRAFLDDIERGRRGPLEPLATEHAAAVLGIDRDQLLYAAVWARAGSWCMRIGGQ